MYREDTLLHFFYPRYSNNQKAKILHNTSILAVVLFLFLYQIFLRFLPYTGVKILGYASNISSSEIISLTNQRRESYGLSTLHDNSLLEKAARLKGEHMLKNGYWAHVAPDGTEPWFFFIENGYKYRYAGENLARDFPDPKSAVEAWMVSPSHKENLLSDKYEDIGVAVVEGDLNGVETTIIVQLFGTSLDSTGLQIPVVQAKPQSAAVAGEPEAEDIPNSMSKVAPITPQPTLTGEKILQVDGTIQKEAGAFRLLISPFSSTKRISFITLGVLTAVMVVDAIVVVRKRITRIGGRSIAHIAFMIMVISLVLIARAGNVL